MPPHIPRLPPLTPLPPPPPAPTVTIDPNRFHTTGLPRSPDATTAPALTPNSAIPTPNGTIPSMGADGINLQADTIQLSRISVLSCASDGFVWAGSSTTVTD